MSGTEREVIATGRTVQEAIAAGSAQLGLRAEEATVEVLEEPGRTWLGLGGRQARVRLARPAKGEAAAALLRRVAEILGSPLEVEVERQDGDPPVWCLRVSTDDPARWIGRRGQTLDALRVWCDAAATRVSATRERLALDVEGYRERRESALRFLATRAAAEVRRSGRPLALEPMVPADRRIVHLALQEVEGVETASEGDEPERHVVVRPAR